MAPVFIILRHELSVAKKVSKLFTQGYCIENRRKRNAHKIPVVILGVKFRCSNLAVDTV